MTDTAPAWIQAGSAVVIAVLTVSLIRATKKYVKKTGALVERTGDLVIETKRMADQMAEDARARAGEGSRAAARRLHEKILAIQPRLDTNHGREPLREVLTDVEQAVLSEHQFLDDEELCDRVQTFYRLVIDGAMYPDNAFPDETMALFRVLESLRWIKQDLADHARAQPLSPRRLPHYQRSGDWLSALHAARVEDYQTD